MRYVSVEVTLIENSTAGKPPRVFAGQTIEISHVQDTVLPSTDGKLSRGRHPSKIFWPGGSAAYFAGVTNVRVVASDGAVLIDDWSMCASFDLPRDTTNGVEFSVLRED